MPMDEKPLDGDCVNRMFLSEKIRGVHRERCLSNKESFLLFFFSIYLFHNSFIFSYLLVN